MIDTMRPHLLQALRFGLVGVVNTFAGLGTIWLSMYLGLAPVPANIFGYAVGLSVSYVLNSRFTFRGGRTEGAVFRFMVTFAVAYAVNMGLLLASIGPLGIDPYLAQLVASVGYTTTFFILSKFYAFPGSR